jgi:uncharacterized membrane protein YdbT with pleckstrin-like domain
MEEKTIWNSTPSQLTNLTTYVFFFWTIIGPIVAYLRTRFTIYELTNKRLRLKTGVLNQQIEETELYRIRDYSVEKPLLLRLFNLGNIVLHSSDATSSLIKLTAIKDVETVKNLIRDNVEEARKATGTREVDIS